VRLFWFLFFLLSHVTYLIALEVITDPYKGIDYDKINVYNLRKDDTQDCECYDFTFDD
jgi:hypothetical protein